MKREVFIWSCCILAITCFVIGAFSVARHPELALVTGRISLIAWSCFIVAAVYEINRYTNLGTTARVLWTLGLLFLSPIVGLLYLMSARKSLVK